MHSHKLGENELKNLWYPYWFTKYYIELEAKVTSGLLLDIPLGLSTVDDFWWMSILLGKVTSGVRIN